MNESYDFNWITETEADRQVEDALHSLPLAEPPAALFASVMTKIQEQDPFVRPVFRLSWVDFALSAFFAGMIGLAMLLTGWIPRQVWYPQLSMTLRLQLRWFQAFHLDGVLWAALGISITACAIAGMVFVSQWFSRRWDGS